MAMTVLQTGPSRLLRLAGEMTLAQAAELKAALLGGPRAKKDLELDLENTAEIDLTALQLLSTDAREAAARGQVRTAARGAGFGEWPADAAGA